MTDEKLQLIKRVSQAAYPGEDNQYAEIESLETIAMQGICCRPEKLYVLTGKDWYFVLIREMTFVLAYDFASATGKCSEILSIYRDLINLFPGRKGLAFCREGTSYPVLTTLARRGPLKILKDETEIKNGELLHRITMRVERK